MHIKSWRSALRAAAVGGFFIWSAFAQDYDPPSRVARLNYIQGNVSMQPAGVDGWSQAIINRPFTIGDYLYTDQGAQAELHMDVAVIRAAPQTSFSFLNLDDQTVQVSLTQGSMYFRIRNFGSNQVFEVDTPNAAFSLLREGIYRFDVDPNGNTSYVVVRQGQLEVTGGGQAFTLNPGNSVDVSGADQLSYDVESAPSPDQFDNWCSQRDYHEAHLASARYVAPTMVGYEDLDDYGDWQSAPEYGAVWYPRRVESGWAPYRNGHWAWIQPWGWTWVDDAPWGFAPFHYGRWAYISGRWGWCPGPHLVTGPPVRAHYAPALVAFFGGAHFGVSVSVGGGGPSMGWVPLGYGEVYRPPYHVSQNYFHNVNVSNTNIRKDVNITNVYNTTYVTKTTNVTVINNNQRYVNMSAPGAVTAMPQSAFASGRPVARNAIAATPAQVAAIQPGNAAVLAPSVVPTRQAVTPMAGSISAAHPPQQFASRQVIAKHTPPPAAASFEQQRTYVQQHAGQILNPAAVRPVAAARPVAVVREAPRAQAPVAVHAGEHVGNAAAFHRGGPAPQPSQPAAARNATFPDPHQRPMQPAANVPAARPIERPEPNPAQHPAPVVRPEDRQRVIPPAKIGVPPMGPQRPVTPPAHNEARPAEHPVPTPRSAAPPVHTAPPAHATPPPHHEEERKKEPPKKSPQ